ncbi:MAG: potassium transporter TrkG, partial [bacterium]
LIGSLLMTQIEGLPLIDCMFEIASALGTVGLTVGITTRLSLATRMILIVLMFSGRVGGLTLIYAAVPQTYSHSQFVNENVSVG